MPAVLSDPVKKLKHHPPVSAQRLLSFTMTP